MVMIEVSYDTMIHRIKKRGREYEQIEADPSLVDYYKRLLKYYDDWKHEYNASELLVIDGDKYDFVENLYDRKIVLTMVYDKLLEIGSIDNNEHANLIAKLKDIKLTNHVGEFDV